jgi:dynein heavy chain
MPVLEIILEDIAENADSIHADFRLFLTSKPADYFPVSILQNGIKLTTEPPRGIKANLNRSLLAMTNADLEACKKRDIFHKLTIGLCFFHALV